MKKKIRIVECVKLIVILIISLLQFPMEAIKAEETLQTYGVSDEIIEIWNVEDLYDINNNMDGKYKLMTDINLSKDTAKGGSWDFMGNGWEPIGSNGVYGNKKFTGEFDGGGHTICGMRIDISSLPSNCDTLYIGLFAYNEGIIENLNVEGSIKVTSSHELQMGGISGHNNGTIISANYLGDISANGSAKTYAVGGITGINEGTIENVIRESNIDISAKHSIKEVFINNKTYYADSTKVNAGGITGENKGHISNASNMGNVTVTYEQTLQIQASKATIKTSGSTYSNVGGLIGDNKGTIEGECYNKGEISSANTMQTISIIQDSASITFSVYSIGRAGGIAGGNSGEIKGKCYNAGKISANADIDNFYSQWISYSKLSTYDTSSSSNAYAGGIVGYNSADVSGVYNTGKVEAITSSYTKTNANSYTGGIAGFNHSGKISNAYNTGYIYSKCEELEDKVLGSATFNKEYVGGIAGYSKRYSDDANISIESCYNIGTLSSFSYSNRYIYPMGYCDAYSKIKNCYYTSSYTTQTGAKNITTAQMKLQSVLSDFDFEDVWVIDNSTTYKYPQLKNNRQSTLKEIDTLELKTTPSKLAYWTGDNIDTTGGELLVYYVDGTKEGIDITVDMVSGYDMEETGMQTVSVLYRGYLLTYEIAVAKRPAVKSIRLVSEPDKKEFVRGTFFDFTGCKVEILYETDETEIIEVDSTMTTGGNINQAGTYTITYELEGNSLEFEVTVVPVQIIDIKVVSMPEKTSYIVGEKFDSTGLVVDAKYNNGTTKRISECTFSGFDSSKEGTNVVTVTYLEFTTTFEVNIEDKAPIALSVYKLPNKTQYIEGQKFDSSGMIIQGIYENGFVKNVSDYTVSDMLDGIGKQNLIISYRGKETYVPITVIKKQLESISVSVQPKKTIYVEGETFNPEGVVIIGKYNDDTSEEIKGYDLSGTTLSTVGTQTITVSYLGKTVEISVKVVKATLLSITVEEPIKKDYILGEKFDSTGMVVKANYDNGKSVEVTDYIVDGFKEEVGLQTLIVNYDGKTWDFIIHVHSSETEWKIIKEPTCTETGRRVKYYDNGAISSDEEIPAKGHKIVVDKAVAPTCTNTGLTKGSHCSSCNTILVPQEKMEALGHTISAKWVTTDEPTCTEKGQQVKTCTVCKQILQRKEIEPLGHSAVIDKSIEATCITSGKTEGSHCSECGEVLIAQKTVASLGHRESLEWKIIKTPTCIEKGTKVKVCAECGEILYTEKIGTLGHSFTKYISDNNAMCTKDGTKTAICDRCDITNTVIDEKSATGHKIDKWNVVKAATCTEDGKQVLKCVICGEIIDEKDIKALGHSIIVDKAIGATYTATGITEGSHCTVCGTVIQVQKIIPMLKYYNGNTTDGNRVKINSIKNYKAKILKLKNKKKKSVVISLKKLDKNIAYEIQYSMNKKFKKAKSLKKKKNKIILKKLQKNKKYYIRVRIYSKISGKVYYGKWSKKKSIVIRK